MRLTQTPTTLELRRTPAGLWLFSSAFVVAGAFALYIVLTAPGDLSARDKLIAGLIGAGVMAGGLYNAATTYRTTLRMELDQARLHYERSAPLRRALVVDAGIEDITGVAIRQDHDSEGDPWFVLELHVAGVAPLYLASAAQHGRPELQRLASAIEQARDGGTGHRRVAQHRD